MHVIRTRFSLKDRAWYMKDNAPKEVIISAIHIFLVGTSQDHIKYSARDVSNSVSWLDHQNLFEGVLYNTKQGLLESLGATRPDTLCKGRNCNAINGTNHSDECIADHEEVYNNIRN